MDYMPKPFPKMMYHAEHGGRVFATGAEISKAGEGWRSTPFVDSMGNPVPESEVAPAEVYEEEVVNDIPTIEVATPAVPLDPLGMAEYTCPKCGRICGSLAGLGAHKRHCK